jgi:hypothetical protein
VALDDFQIKNLLHFLHPLSSQTICFKREYPLHHFLGYKKIRMQHSTFQFQRSCNFNCIHVFSKQAPKFLIRELLSKSSSIHYLRSMSLSHHYCACLENGDGCPSLAVSGSCTSPFPETNTCSEILILGKSSNLGSHNAHF